MELNNELKINVKASLSVDEETFRTCMNLLKIYCQGRFENCKGAVIKFEDDPWCDSGYMVVDTDAEMDRIWFGCVPEKEETKNGR